MDESKAKYNCYIYAFGLSSDPDFLSFNKDIINDIKKIDVRGTTIEYLLRFGKLEKTESPSKGDYLLYKMQGHVTHMGIFVDTDCIISKFGTNPEIIKHKINYCFTEYGDEYEFYKRKNPDEIKRLLCP